MQVERQDQIDTFLSQSNQEDLDSAKEQEYGSPKQSAFGSSIRQVNDFEITKAEQTFMKAQSKDEAPSALEHINHTYELIKAAQVILESYKQEVQELKEEINSIKPATEPFQEEICKMVKPKLQEFQQQIEKNPKHQDEINKIFQLSIAQLKKEDKSIDQEIVKVIDRIQVLETVLGKYQKKN